MQDTEAHRRTSLSEHAKASMHARSFSCDFLAGACVMSSYDTCKHYNTGYLLVLLVEIVCMTSEAACMRTVTPSYVLYPSSCLAFIGSVLDKHMNLWTKLATCTHDL